MNWKSWITRIMNFLRFINFEKIEILNIIEQICKNQKKLPFLDIVKNTNFVDYLLNAARVCDSTEYFLNFDSKSILKIPVFKDLVYTVVFCMPFRKCVLLSLEYYF